MKTLIRINNIVLILLGLATGLVKVFGLEADVEIFANMGFSYFATVIFGVVQTVAAILIIFPQTRRYGAVILGISFVIATYGLFISGLIPFGIFSLLFIAMAVVAFLSADSKAESVNLGR